MSRPDRLATQLVDASCEFLRRKPWDVLTPDADTCIEQACALAREWGESLGAFAGVKAGVVAPVVNNIRELREALDRRFVDLWFSTKTTAAREQTVEQLTSKG